MVRQCKGQAPYVRPFSDSFGTLGRTLSDSQAFEPGGLARLPVLPFLVFFGKRQGKPTKRGQIPCLFLGKRQGKPPKRQRSLIPAEPLLGGRFGYFLFFSARGRGRGSPRAPGGGGGGISFSANPTRGGGSPGGAEGSGGCLRRIGDFGRGGAKYFFRGRNVRQA